MLCKAIHFIVTARVLCYTIRKADSIAAHERTVCVRASKSVIASPRSGATGEDTGVYHEFFEFTVYCTQ